MIFLHGSYDPHPEGRRLTPVPGLSAAWEAIPFVQVLERYRPDWGVPHAEAVFLCEDPDHLDPCGAPLEHVFEVSPEGSFSRHDQSWVSRISCLLDDREPDHPEITRAADGYWSGLGDPVPGRGGDAGPARPLRGSAGSRVLTIIYEETLT